MAVDGVIPGKIYQRAEQLTSKTGNPFVTAKVRARLKGGAAHVG